MGRASFQFRLLLIGPTILGVLSLSFLIFRVVPGDPTVGILGEYASTAERATLRRELGLDQPLPQQYLTYMQQVLGGDFGDSLLSRRPALGEALRVFPASIGLAGAGVLLAILIALPLGLLSAAHPNSWLDHLATLIALAGTAFPSFWIAQLALLVFVTQLDLVPAVVITADLPTQLAAMLLPATVLAFTLCAPLARLIRALLPAALRHPAISAARGRGIGEWSLWLRHALPNTLAPLIAAAGGLLGWAIGNALLIEAVFARPGIGTLLVTAVAGRDYPLIQACVFLIALSVTLINSLLDLLYQLLDPRLRTG